MGKTITTIIDRFDGGLSEDKRDGWSYSGGTFFTNKYSITKHFDALTFPHKLVPYTKTQACDNEQKSYNIRKFQYANGRLYGLGDPTSGNATRIQIYETLVGGTDSWSASTNGTGTTVTKTTNVFFSYTISGVVYLYAMTGGDRISKFDSSGGAFTDSERSVTYTFSWQAQPVLHPSDNIAYFFADNVIHANNAGVWATAITLPSSLRIVSACPFGNYLALGCVTTDTFNVRSIVYLWDRDSSLTTLSERIDFGEGILKHLANLNNKLIGVMDFYREIGVGDAKQSRVYIKQANGQFATILNELTCDAVTTPAGSIANTNFIRTNRMYFPMAAKLNGDTRFGIWVVDELGRATLAIVEEEVNTTSGSYEGIYATGNVWWIAHSADGSVNRSTYTLNSYSSTNASTYESLIFTGGNSSVTKKLSRVKVLTEPLPSAATIVLKYRKDEETSWTQIFSYSTTSGISHAAINIESTGATLPTYKEIQFQILSTNGASPTGLYFESELIEKDL